jgi:hypothetical protein
MKKKIYFLMYDQCIVHGGFFDNFEYYYIIKKVFKDCDVKWRCITEHPRDEVLAVLQEKYESIEQKVWNDIEVCKHSYKKFWRNPLMIDVLVCPTNSAMYWFLKHGNIQAAKSYIGLGDWRDIHPKQNKYYKNHYVLCDERVYQYGDECNWRPYRKKILFDKYKEKDNFRAPDYDYMLNLSLKERRFPREWLMELFKYYGLGNQVRFAAYSGHKNEEYYSWFNEIDDLDLVIPPFDDFMGMFRNFIYVPYRDGSDATPRLIPECIFYDKGIEYYDKGLEKKSGGYWRYQDTMNDFYGLWLKEDDEIMEYIEKCLKK